MPVASRADYLPLILPEPTVLSGPVSAVGTSVREKVGCGVNVPDRQRAMVMNGPGVPLETVERRVDEPGRGQALVRVRASSLNFHDNIHLMGLLPGPWP